MLCGCVAAVMGNRTALPLLASAALCAFLSWMQVPFNPWFWTAIDLMAIVAIVALRWVEMNRSDTAIVALFLPAWALYQVDNVMLQGWGTFTIVVAQFMLTVPFARIWSALRKRVSEGFRHNGFDRRDIAASFRVHF